MIFELKSDLPLSTQEKIDAIEAIPVARRTASQTAFLDSLSPYLTNVVLSVGDDGLINSASGLTVPTGYEGFRKGASFIKTDATGNGLYVNAGDETSASWDLNETPVTPTGTPVNGVASQGTLTVTGGGTQIADGYTVTLDSGANEKVYTFKTALTPTEGEVLIGVSDTAALLNLLNALNHTGTPGTDYSVAAAHPTVKGESSDATTLVAEARTAGVAGDSIASTSTGAEISWDGTTLGTTQAGVDATAGEAGSLLYDSTNLYVATGTDTWKKLQLQTI